MMSAMLLQELAVIIRQAGGRPGSKDGSHGGGQLLNCADGVGCSMPTAMLLTAAILVHGCFDDYEGSSSGAHQDRAGKPT